MSPGEIADLRRELECTAKELATALGVEQAEVLAWEKGELFPTKKRIVAMAVLRKKGPAAIARRPRGKGKSTPIAALGDPELWAVVRKLAAHPQLLEEVRKLCDRYDDPTG